MFNFFYKKALIVFILISACLNNLNAVKFIFDIDNNTNKSIQLKIRIFSPDKYDAPFKKLTIAHNEVGEIDFAELLKEIKFKVAQLPSKRLFMTCEPVKSEYSYSVLDLIKIDDYTTFDFSEFAQTQFTIKISTDLLMRQIALTMEK